MKNKKFSNGSDDASQVKPLAKKSLFKKAMIFSTLIVGLAAIGYLGQLLFSHSGPNIFANKDKNRKAVFLDNGQVYFGYIIDSNNQTIQLTDVYYLKSNDLESSDPEKKIILVQMGHELHGPQNTMYINRDQVLFYQDLTKDSKINDVINRFTSTQ